MRSTTVPVVGSGKIGTSVVRNELRETIATAQKQISGTDAKLEVELRFVTGETGESGVSRSQFNRLRGFLRQRGADVKAIHISDRSVGDYRMSIIGGQTKYIIKRRVGYPLLDPDMWHKTVVSTELPISETEFKRQERESGIEVFARPKIREHYHINIKDGIKWRIDLTQVNSDQRTTYEVEAECLEVIRFMSLTDTSQNRERFNIASFIAKKLWSRYEGPSHFFTKSLHTKLYETELKKHGKITQVKPRNFRRSDFAGVVTPAGVDDDYEVSQKTDGVWQLLYISKTFGVWLINFITSEYTLITKTKQEEKIRPGRAITNGIPLLEWLRKYDGMMLDGDLVTEDLKLITEAAGSMESAIPRFVVSDILMHNGSTKIQDITPKSRRREFFAPLLLTDISPNPDTPVALDQKTELLGLILVGKDHIPTREGRTSLAQAVTKLWVGGSFRLPRRPRAGHSITNFKSSDEVKREVQDEIQLVVHPRTKISFPIDGLILTAANAPYIPRTVDGTPVQELDLSVRSAAKYPDVMKWKPRYTVDVYYDKVGPNPGLYSAGRRGNLQDRQPFELDLSVIDTASIPDSIGPDDIIEVYWDLSKFKYVYLKSRPDRPYANEYHVAQDTRDHMIDPIMLSTMLGRDLVVYRRYHSAIKDWCIQQIGPGAIVWDWGSGKGGDLTKWNRAGFKRVYVTEPNTTNFTELTSRLDNLRQGRNYRTEIILANQSVQEVKIPEQVDAITAFFMLGFLWQSDTLKLVAGRVMQHLRPGGIMAVTILDANSLLSNNITGLFGPEDERGEHLYTLQVDVGKRTVDFSMKDAATVTKQTENLVFIEDLLALTDLEVVEWYWASRDTSLSDTEMNLSRHYAYGLLRRPSPQDRDQMTYDIPPQLPVVENLALRHQTDRLWHDLGSMSS